MQPDILLRFLDEKKGPRNLRLPHPAYTPSQAELKEIMQAIVDLKLFSKDGVNLYDTPVSASASITTVTELYVAS